VADVTAIPQSWSYSRFDAWRTCPAKYRYKFVDKLPEPQSPAMARGSRVHSQLEAYLGGKGDLPAEVKGGYHAAVYDMIRDHEDKVVEDKWGFTSVWAKTGWMADDVWLRSIVDVAMRHADGSITVVDHKTGRRYASNDDQMEVFATATLSRFPDAQRVETRLIYLEQDKIEEIALFKWDDADKLRDKWARAVQPMLGDRDFPARPNDKCRWCAFSRDAGGPCKVA
jgi:putative RecB family exonuclease